jgi:Holliday junction resolvase-like predicted endonuclease
VTPAKQRQVVRVAQYFLVSHPRLFIHPIRFDVVAVDVRGETCEITHVRDACTA